jgi:hypothetical protein
MNQDNKEAGSDMKFLFWDDPGDSQENVDNQCNHKDWQREIAQRELGKTCCSAHARDTDEEERKAEERMMIIMRNGNTGEGYPEYQDYTDDTDEE